MKTIKITIKEGVKLTLNTVFTEVSEDEKYDLIITECGSDGFFKSTKKQLGKLRLKRNDCWLDNANILRNQSGFITTLGENLKN